MVTVHPMWVIDEYARIFCTVVWFSPHPRKINIIAEMKTKGWLMIVEIWKWIDSGAIFCDVNKITPDSNIIPCVTYGTQKWKGARPNFIIKVGLE